MTTAYDVTVTRDDNLWADLTDLDDRRAHVSLAKVDHHDLTSATGIGRRAFGIQHPVRTRTLDLCDIGPRNERWDVLASSPIREIK